METGIATNHRTAHHHFPPGHILSFGLALPSSTKGNPPFENTKAENQEQGQGEEQAAGRQAAVLRVYSPEKSHGADHLALHLLVARGHL